MKLEKIPITMSAAWWHLVVSSAFSLLLLTCVAVRPLAATLVQAQVRDLPPRLMVRVPVTPIPVPGGDSVHMVYELHVTNIDPRGRDVTLKRVHAVGSDGATLLSYQDSVLRRNLGRPGMDRRHQAPSTNVDGPERLRLAGGMLAVVYMWVTVDSAAVVPSLIRHHLTVQHEDEAGDSMTSVLEGSPTAPHGEAVAIGPPLRGGNWQATDIWNGSHHRRALYPTSGHVQQRFAIDYERVDEFGLDYSGDRYVRENYYAYGADVLAVADAMVVSMHDGGPDPVPWVPAELGLAMNYVDLDLGDGRYAFYAHLQSGSVRVQAGERVRRGEVLGRVGNSGAASGTDATTPHLHFHLSTAPRLPRPWSGLEPHLGEGVPYVHPSFEVVEGCTCTGAECSVRAAEQHEFEMPLRGLVVRFPDEKDRGGREHAATGVPAERTEAICRAMEGWYLIQSYVDRIAEAMTAYAEAQARDPTLRIPAEHWTGLCWYGSVWEHAAEVMPACEQAVALDPENGWSRGARAWARALTGDYEGAIADFEAYVAWERRETGLVALTGGWIDTLRAGENPFTPELLANFRN